MLKTLALFVVLTIGGTVLSFALTYGLAVTIGMSHQDAVVQGIVSAVSCFAVATLGSLFGILMVHAST